MSARGTRVAATVRPPAFADRPEATGSRAARLAREAIEAAEVRRYLTHPDVIALRVERVRAQVDRMCWSGIVLGLAFTMTNVQGFAAGDAHPWSLRWLAAWLLDPTVSLVLLAILRAEQVTARYRVRTGPWVRRAKWFTLAATYVMNTWSAYAAGSAALVVLHSVPPLVVFVAAEAITDVRERLTEAAMVAHRTATAAGVEPLVAPAAVMVQSGERRVDGERCRSRPGRASKRRTSFAEYFARAQAAWSPGVVVSPAWIREVTGCSRGLSPRLAATLAAEVASRPNADHGDAEAQP